MKQFLKIFLWIMLGNILFYFSQAILNKEFGFLKISNLKTIEDFIYYLIILSFFPIIEFLILGISMNFILMKIKKGSVFFTIIILLFITEYILYVYYTSESLFDLDGIIKVFISLILFLILFIKEIRSYSKHHCFNI